MTRESVSPGEDPGNGVVEGSSPVKFHTTRKNVLISAALAAGSFLYGFTTNVISGALALPSFNALFLGVDSEPRIGGMLGIFFTGGVFGAVIQQPISDRYGRRAAMGVAGIFLAVGSAICAGSVHYAMFIVARFVAGIGSSIAFTIAPVFISELAPPHSRGKLVSLHVVGFNTGFLISSLGSLGFSYMNQPVQWRLNFVINTAISVLLVLIVVFVPESPRWLVSKDRIDEAGRILHRLHGGEYDLSDSIARAELVQITQQIEASKSLERGYKHILTTPSLRKRAYCTVLVWFAGMSTGVLVLANLTPLLFAGLGYGSTTQFGLSTAWLVCCILTAGLGGLMVDRMGRVLFMALGLTTCAIAMAVEAAMQAEFLNTTNKQGLATGVAFYFLFASFYNAFYDAGSFVYTVEIWPNHLRSEGMTIAMVTFYVTNIVWNSPATVALRNIGWRYYLIFVCISTAGAIAVWTLLPETRGLTLEEIGEKFGEKPQTQRIQDIARSKDTCASREGDEVEKV